MFCQHFLAFLPLIDHPAQLIPCNTVLKSLRFFTWEKQGWREKTRSQKRHKVTELVQDLEWQYHHCAERLIMFLPIFLEPKIFFFSSKNKSKKVKKAPNLLHLTGCIMFRHGNSLWKSKGCRTKLTWPLKAYLSSEYMWLMLPLLAPTNQRVSHRHCTHTRAH